MSCARGRVYKEVEIGRRLPFVIQQETEKGIVRWCNENIISSLMDTGLIPVLTTKSHESELTARNRRQSSQVAELVDVAAQNCA